MIATAGSGHEDVALEGEGEEKCKQNHVLSLKSGEKALSSVPACSGEGWTGV